MNNEACRKDFDDIWGDPSATMCSKAQCFGIFQAAYNLRPVLMVEDIKSIISSHSEIVDLPPDDSTEAILWSDYDNLAKAIHAAQEAKRNE